jgi:hypothetical protein
MHALSTPARDREQVTLTNQPDIAVSNSLADLAARIRAEHEAASDEERAPSDMEAAS